MSCLGGSSLSKHLFLFLDDQIVPGGAFGLGCELGFLFVGYLFDGLIDTSSLGFSFGDSVRLGSLLALPLDGSGAVVLLYQVLGRGVVEGQHLTGFVDAEV